MSRSLAMGAHYRNKSRRSEARPRCISQYRENPMKQASTKLDSLLVVAFSLMMGLALWCRITSLGTSPMAGHDGDGAFFGVQAERLAHGQPIELRTGGGKPVDPLYIVAEAPLHLVVKPSFVIQRLPAVLFGALAVVLLYRCTFRTMDLETALIASGLLACLPIAIIYSRLGLGSRSLQRLYQPIRTVAAFLYVRTSHQPNHGLHGSRRSLYSWRPVDHGTSGTKNRRGSWTRGDRVGTDWPGCPLRRYHLRQRTGSCSTRILFRLEYA
jgi:hypothetical protein